jgi:glycosyltransferase involved in cell wall biosynthesis
MRKKILFVAYSITGGGSEKRLASILRGLDRERFEPHLCLFSLSGNEGAIVPADIPLHPLGTSLRPASLFLFWNLYRLIRRVKPDKVFSVLWSVNIIAAAAAMLAGVPAVLNEATTPSESVLRYSFPSLRSRLIAFFYARAARVITVSDYARNDLERNFGLSAGRAITVHNGISAADLEQASLAYDPGPAGYILACGGLNWWKNYSLLIKAMAGIAGGRLIILGKGPLEGRLRQEAAAAGVNLVLPGQIENPYPYFKKAAALVLTSKYEGFPNVLLEGMACGTPVVAVDCPGGIREIIESGRTGLIVPQNDAAALRAALTGLLEDSALAKRLADGARKKLEEKFPLEKMLAGYSRALE